MKAGNRAVELPMVLWGLPAGFSTDADALDALVRSGRISRWEHAGRSLRLYLPTLESHATARISLAFVAELAGTLHSAPTRVYPYYDPRDRTLLPPTVFHVR